MSLRYHNKDCTLIFEISNTVLPEYLFQISENCNKAVGVDKSRIRLSEARDLWRNVSNLQFHEADAFDFSTLQKLGCFSVIFVDISGNRELRTVLPLIERLQKVFPVSHFQNEAD